MIPYFLLVFLLILANIISKRCRISTGEKMFCYERTFSIDIFMIILLSLLSLRSVQCGNDTVQYLSLFKQYSFSSMEKLFIIQDDEIGYKLLNKLIGMQTDNFQIVLLITSLFCIVPLWYFYRRETENPTLTIALFLGVAPFAMYFSGIRQSIAMSIGILAMYAVRNKKLFVLVLIVLLAMQFHNSAFVLFVLYPLYHIQLRRKHIWVVAIVIILVYIYKNAIFTFMFRFLWKDYELTSETGSIAIFLLLVLFAVYSYIIVDEQSLDKDTIGLRNILLLSVVLQMFAMLHPLSMRMNYYFLLYIPILIPKIANRCHKQFKEIAILSTIVMTIYFMYYFLMNGMTGKDHLNIFPYIPFWEIQYY